MNQKFFSAAALLALTATSMPIGMTNTAVAQTVVDICNFATTADVTAAGYDSAADAYASNDCIEYLQVEYSISKDMPSETKGIVDTADFFDNDGNEVLSPGDDVNFVIWVGDAPGPGNFTITDTFDDVNFDYVSTTAVGGFTASTVIGATPNELIITTTGMDTLQSGDYVIVTLNYTNTDNTLENTCNDLTQWVDNTTNVTYLPADMADAQACADEVTEVFSYKVEKTVEGLFDSAGVAKTGTMYPNEFVHFQIGLAANSDVPPSADVYDYYATGAFDAQTADPGIGVTPTLASSGPVIGTPAGNDHLLYGAYDFSAGAIDVVMEVN